MAPLAFLSIHVGGGALAIATLPDAWSFRLLLQLLIERNPVFGDIATTTGASVWLVPACLMLTAILAAVGVGKTAARWWRRAPEPHTAVRLRAILYASLACVCVNAFLLSTPESLDGPFRLRYPIVGQISAALAYGAYALWTLALPKLRRTLPAFLRRGLGISCLTAALALVGTEVGLRIASVLSPSLLTAPLSSEIRRDSERQVPGSGRFGFPINRGGHYDTEFVGGSDAPRPLVVSIGDSFSYGSVPHAFHFTTVAERCWPGATFYNVGYPGISPSDYAHLLEHVALPLEPDLVVVQLFLGNDVEADPNPPGPPRWYDADRYWVAILWHRLIVSWRAKLHAPAPIGQTPEQLLEVFPWLADPLLEQPALSADAFSTLEAQRARAICSPNPHLFERFFAELAALEHAAGEVPLAFVVIPDEFQVEDEVWQDVLARTGERLERNLAQRRVARWLRRRGLPVLDLWPVLRAAEPLEDGRRHVYHLRDTHFNVRGNDLAGSALAGFARRLLTAARPLDRSRTLPLHLDLGTQQSRAFLRGGWSYDEVADGESFVWSDGTPSVLALPMPSSGDIRMSFVVRPLVFPGSPPQSISFAIDQTAVAEVPLHQGKRRYSVVLPRDVLAGPRTTIELRYAYTRAPKDVIAGSADHRQLGVAWHSIDIAETDR